MATCEDYGLTPEECAQLTPQEKADYGIEAGTSSAAKYEAPEQPLRNFVGRYLIDVGTGQAGVLRYFKTRQGDVYQLRDPLTNALIGSVTRGGNLLDPANRRVIAISGNYNTVRESTASEADIRRFFGTEGVSGVGGGSGRTQAEEDLTRAQIADLQAQQELDRQRIEIDRQRQLEERRQNLLAAALRLTESVVGEREKAQAQSTELAGYDPFRFIGSLRGVATPADVKTPYDIFKGTLAQRATQQTPDIGPNSSIQDLESALGKLQQIQQSNQNQGSAFGFAAGGVMPQSTMPTARLVGEAGSTIAPGTEVAISQNGQTMILPLAPGLQTGGTTDSYLTPGSLGIFPQLFSNLRTRLTANMPDARAALGYLPEGNTTITTGGYGGRAELGSTGLRRGYQELVSAGKISQQDADFITNAIGELPNPRNAAADQWFRNLTPTELEAVHSLYRLAGIPEAELDAMVKSALSLGPRRTPISYAA